MYIDFFYEDFTLPYLDTVSWEMESGSISSLTLGGSGYLTMAPASTVAIRTLSMVMSPTSSVFIGMENFTGAGTFEFLVDNLPSPTTTSYGFRLSGTTLTMLHVASGNTTITYSATAMKYWRLRNASTMILWETSPDGYSWTVRRSLTTSPLTSARVHIRTSNAGARVLRVNTITHVPRGQWWLKDNFDYKPSIVVTSTPSMQTGLWRSTGSAVTLSNVMQLNANGVAIAAPQTITEISQVDIRFLAKFDWSVASPTPHSVNWRTKADGSAYNSVRIYPDKVEFSSTSGGSTNVLATANVTNEGEPSTMDKWYKWRILNFSSTLVVYKDDVELIRVENSPALTTGSISFKAGNNKYYVDNVEIRELTYDPTETDSFTMNTPQKQPTSYVQAKYNTQFEYIRLEDASGRTLVLSPSYGSIWVKDIDFGSPSARSVVNPRTQMDGTRNYTRFHADKTVTATLFVFTDAYGSTHQYKDALSFWALPGKQCRMVFKLAREEERYMDLIGSSYQSPISTESRQHAEMTMSWVCPDGGSYSSKLNILTLAANAVTTVTNLGSDRTEPVIRIMGATGSGYVRSLSYEEANPGQQARLGIGNLDSQSFAEFNYKNRTVMHNGVVSEATNMSPYMTARYWFPLDLGNNTIYADTLGAEIHWRDKYLI